VERTRNLSRNAALLWLAELGAEQAKRIEVTNELAAHNRAAWDAFRERESLEAQDAPEATDEDWDRAIEAARDLFG